jgi:thiamine transport system substrate-binding protein
MKSCLLAMMLGALSVSLACSRFPDWGSGSKKNAGPSLRVLTYSSLGSKDGFLAKVKPQFLAESGCELLTETTLGATQVLSYLEEPSQQKVLDVVMGLDSVLFERAQHYLYPVSPIQFEYLDLVRPQVRGGFYPTDYAALSFIYKKSEFKDNQLPLPKTIRDLLHPKLKNRFIIQDPRNSSPGLWFFLFADQLVKTEDLSKQWLALSPSWDSGYKMFLAGEAPMVWSYLTSLAYHASQGQADDYGYVDFEEGLPVQVEGLAVVKKDQNPFDLNPCIEKWIRFVMKPESQRILAETQFMLPAIHSAPIPPFLKMVPTPKKSAAVQSSIPKVDQLISEFGKRIRR